MSNLSDRDTEALAYVFAIHWCALVLSPGTQRLERSLFVRFGLVKERGPLALTATGKRVIAFCRAEDRPKYPDIRRRRRKKVRRQK